MIKGIVRGAVVAAAALTLGVTSATTASADTRDNYWDDEGAGSSVMWNDYVDGKPYEDLDDIWVMDEWGDGYSVKLEVTYDGEIVGSAHAYRGEVAKAYFGNIPKGHSVSWDTCLWNEGEPVTDGDGYPVCLGGSFVE